MWILIAQYMVGNQHMGPSQDLVLFGSVLWLGWQLIQCHYSLCARLWLASAHMNVIYTVIWVLGLTPGSSAGTSSLNH